MMIIPILFLAAGSLALSACTIITTEGRRPVPPSEPEPEPVPSHDSYDLLACPSQHCDVQAQSIAADFKDSFGHAEEFDQIILPLLKEKCGSPKELSQWYAVIKKSIRDFEDAYGDAADFDKLKSDYIARVIPEILKKGSSSSDLGGWCLGVSRLLKAYDRKKFSNLGRYVEHSVPSVLKGCKSFAQLNLAAEFILDYTQRIGDPNAYAKDILPLLLEKNASEAELRKWDSEVKKLISGQGEGNKDAQTYISKVLPHFIKKSSSVEELARWGTEIEKLIKASDRIFRDPDRFVSLILPTLMGRSSSPDDFRAWGAETVSIAGAYRRVCGKPEKIVDSFNKLIKKCASAKELRAARTFILDYLGRIARPIHYLDHNLVGLLGKADSIEGLKQWNAEVKALLADYRKRFGKPDVYARGALKAFIDKCGSIKDLKEWDKASKQYIISYSESFGDPEAYVTVLLPTLISKSNSLEDLQKWDTAARSMIKHYNNDRFLYVMYVLPRIAWYAGSIEDFQGLNRAATLTINDWSKPFSKPELFIERDLSAVLDEFPSFEELREIGGLLGDCAWKYDLSASADNSWLPGILKHTRSLEELKQARLLISSYVKRFGEPGPYARSLIANVLKKSDSADKLLKARMLVVNYSSRFGDPFLFVDNVLPILIEGCSAADLDQWGAQVLDIISIHVMSGGNIKEYVRGELPKVVKSVGSLGELYWLAGKGPRR
jgi:hypothetical protein